MKKLMKRFIFTFHNEWVQLFNKFNWYTFTMFHCFFEYDKWLKGLVFEVTLLGFGFTIRYNLPSSDAIFEKMEKEVKKVIKKSK